MVYHYRIIDNWGVSYMKSGNFDVTYYGKKRNYAVEWISLNGKLKRIVYEKREDVVKQQCHLDHLGRWNSGVKKLIKLPEGWEQ